MPQLSYLWGASDIIGTKVFETIFLCEDLNFVHLDHLPHVFCVI
jgi:hypothetical protein